MTSGRDYIIANSPSPASCTLHRAHPGSGEGAEMREVNDHKSDNETSPRPHLHIGHGSSVEGMLSELAVLSWRIRRTNQG